MQIIIDIPTDHYNEIVYGSVNKIRQCVKNGITLPKGHGRLIDADELYLDIQTDEEMRLGNENLLWIKERIDLSLTIIEADKEVEK